jgi:predicted dehydrogenase
MNRRDFLQFAGASLALSPFALGQDTAKPARIAIIGVGGRGTSLLRTMLKLPNVVIPAICDIDPSHLARACSMCEKALGKKPEGYSMGPYDYRRMLARDDFDGVLIATPAELHAEMAIDSMKLGKSVGSEVPGAYKLQDCWDLVDTKEQTGKRYMLLENYFYSPVRMMVHNMVHRGALGEPCYAECSYIHDCRSLRFSAKGELTWRGEGKRDNYGCLYPTHSLGPIAKWFDINRGDVMTELTSVMSPAVAISHYAAKRFGADSPQAKIPFKNGDMSVTHVKTAKGKLITVFYDSDSPRPCNNFYLIQGTKGLYDSRKGIHIEGRTKRERYDHSNDYMEEFRHDYWRDRGEEAKKTGHGGGDYFVVSDFVEMVRHDREPFIDVYDSAAWSSLVELSKQSIDGKKTIEMPDFTRGKWKTRKA